MQEQTIRVQQWAITVLFAIVVAFMVSYSGFSLRINASRLIVNCSSFDTQAAAQAALWMHPSLDGDHDGRACESLK